MAPKIENNRPQPLSQDEFTAMLAGQLKDAVRVALVTILEAEVTALVGALPYERSISTQGLRLTSGTAITHYSRDLDTTVGAHRHIGTSRAWQCLAPEHPSTRVPEEAIKHSSLSGTLLSGTLAVVQRWTPPFRICSLGGKGVSTRQVG